MLLSQTAEYALRAVLHLAGQPAGSSVRVPALAAATGVPRNYLSKTLHLLVRAGVLHSTRGPAGGFRLAGDPRRLTLRQVVAPFAGPDTRRCLMNDTPCGDQPCAVHARWVPVRRQLDAFFGATNVADLAGGAEVTSASLLHPQPPLQPSVQDGGILP
jgi:Rrf2 family protein